MCGFSAHISTIPKLTRHDIDIRTHRNNSAAEQLAVYVECSRTLRLDLHAKKIDIVDIVTFAVHTIIGHSCVYVCGIAIAILDENHCFHQQHINPYGFGHEF